MNIEMDLELVGGLLGLIAGVILVIAVLKKHPKAEGLSFATFFLWGGLDLINAGTAYIGGQPIVLPLMFGVFSLIIAGALVLRGKFRWSWFETLVTVAVIVCIVVWLSAGSTAAFWASILSLFLASLPQMVEAHNKPEAMFRIPWLFYWLACFVTVIGLISQGKERIDELIYAGMGIFTLGVMIFFIYTRPSSNQSSID